MTGLLFAGIRVSDFAAARSWYERLLGAEPSFLPHATEAVWELGEHRYLYILGDPDSPGNALTPIPRRALSRRTIQTPIRLWLYDTARKPGAPASRETRR